MAPVAAASSQEILVRMAPIGGDAGGSGSGGRKAEDAERLPMPSQNPLPLSASQEAQVREIFNARVREHCSEDIKAFAACALNRTFTIPFACRALSRAMNGCMLAHATQEEHDRAREDWFAARMARARERERKERRRLEQERFHREWWGLPDRDPEEIRRELEKLERPERVAGVAAVRRPPTQQNPGTTMNSTTTTTTTTTKDERGR